MFPHTWYFYLSQVCLPHQGQELLLSSYQQESYYTYQCMPSAKAKWSYYLCASLVFIQYMFTKEPNMFQASRATTLSKTRHGLCPTGAYNLGENKTIIK